MGYGGDEANTLAKELIDVGESVTGVLVKRSPRELGFYHRSIQEHLAATHLLTSSEQAQLTDVGVHAADPQWRDVILSLASRASSQEIVDKIVDAIRTGSTGPGLAGQRRAELLAEIASGGAARAH